MKERRRGLGRGLGALIPTSPEGARPVDVFFPAAPSENESSVATLERDEALAEEGDTVAPSTVTEDPHSEEGRGVGDAAAERTQGARPEATAVSPGTAAIGAGDEGDAAGHSADAGPEGEGPAEQGVHHAGPATPEAISVAVEHVTGSDAVEPSDGAIETRDASGGTSNGWVDRQEADAGAATPAPAAGADPGTGNLVPVPGASFAEIPVNQIRPNSRQPRTVFDEGELDELIGSIREIGILQPIVVRPDPDEPGAYELIMGERRWRAAQAAGLDEVPAIVRVTDDEDMLRDALLENLHRSALNPLEEAAAYRQLLDDFGCTHDELATRISRSRPQISNTLRLLRLPPLVQRRVAAGVLSAGHARALLSLSDAAAAERLAQKIVAEGLSVRATEELVALGDGDERPRRPAPRAGQRSEAVDQLASRLSDRFETRVRVDLGKAKGRVTIEFASVEDLNRILDVMAPNDPGLLRR